jgi:hypothetical protein
MPAEMLRKFSGIHQRLLIILCLTTLLVSRSVACASFQQTKLTIHWTTASELDIIGFNLYRSETPDGEFIQVNTLLIPASPDAVVGGQYTFVDSSVSRGKTYYYQLETIDRQGNSSRSQTIILKAGR